MCQVCCSTSAAYRCSDPLPESLIDQSIYKRIDSRVEQDHPISDGVRDIVWFVCSAVVAHHIDDSISQPADCKDATDDYHHQGDSLPYPYHTLQINIVRMSCF